MANTYDKGDLIRVTGTFEDADGTAVDPTAVVFKIKDPSDNVSTLTYGVDAAVVRSASGVYYTDVNADENGAWNVRLEATGTGQCAGELSFDIRRSNVV